MAGDVELERAGLRRRYDELWTSDPSHFTSSRDFQVEVLRTHGVTPDREVLDFGCGPGPASAVLTTYLEPGMYTGVDISAAAIEAARGFLAAAELAWKQPRLLVSAGEASFASRFAASFDCVWAQSVITHLSDHLVADLMGMVAAVLRVDGDALFTYYRDETGHGVERIDANGKDWAFSEEKLAEIGAEHHLDVRRVPGFSHPGKAFHPRRMELAHARHAAR